MKKLQKLVVFLMCIFMVIIFSITGCSLASEQTKNEDKKTEIEAEEEAEEEPGELSEEAAEESTSGEAATWDEWLEGYKEAVKEMIKDYFGGELTKVVFEQDSKGPIIAYNTKWSSADTIKKELFDITKIMATGDHALLDLDLSATSDNGDSIRAYTTAKYMKKIEDLELSYDEWVEVAIEGKEIADDGAATEEESETEEVPAVENDDEENVLTQIMEEAKRDWPNDKDMQEFQYNNQVEAYHDILDLPGTSDYREDILTEAQKDWTGDYEMQLFQYDNQLEAYLEIQQLPSTGDYNESALNRAKSDWPGDYEMQLWQYNNEK